MHDPRTGAMRPHTKSRAMAEPPVPTMSLERVPPIHACTHAASLPAFDADAAHGQSATWVRQHFPRFVGHCATCGQQAILYASWEHYIAGNW